jgi:hypothetical protein
MCFSSNEICLDCPIEVIRSQARAWLTNIHGCESCPRIRLFSSAGSPKILYWDWATLDAVRRTRAANWFEVTPLYSEEHKQVFLEAEAEIRNRYSAEEFESLKRNMFGLSLEQRATIAGLSKLYDASYRVLSRNVHAMDVAVMKVTKSSSSSMEYEELLEARTSHVLDIAQWCLGTLAIWVNGQFRCGFDEQLKKLQARS